MVCIREGWAAGATAWVIVLGLVCESALGREVKLVVRPQKVSAEAGKYALLPPPASLTDGDAVPLYDKATKMLPGKANDDQVQQYLKMPIDKLPADQAEQTLKSYIESLKCAARAVKCRECRWSVAEFETVAAKSGEYRRLAYAIQLWARDEIAQDNQEGAILALQTGFGMARHLVQAPSALLFGRGTTMAGVLCREIEQYVQMEDAPNLYAALAALPRPFFADVEKVIESETKAFPSKPPAGVTPAQLESELKLKAQSYDQWRAMAKRLERDLAALQCIEAIRSYAASHKGQLPQTLAEITEVSVPKDPISGEAFRYAGTGATAVLESPAPPGGEKKEPSVSECLRQYLAVN
jgi:hypothetical protein